MDAIKVKFFILILVLGSSATAFADGILEGIVDGINDTYVQLSDDFSDLTKSFGKKTEVISNNIEQFARHTREDIQSGLEHASNKLLDTHAKQKNGSKK